MEEKMKKDLVFLAVLLLLLAVVPPSINAAVMLNEPASVYNLGDTLDVKINISQPESFNGFLTLNIDCDNFSFLFYKVPISIEAEEEKLLEAPSLSLSKRMLGLCYIKATLEDVEDNVIDKTSTEHFTISDVINLTVVFNKKIFLPGEKLIIEGRAIKINGKKVDGSAKITLNGKDYSSDVKGSFFEAEISLAKDVKSGEHDVKISVSDTSGNKGSASGNISITAVPTTLELELNKKTFLPGENLSVKAILYDQAHDEMIRDVTFSLLSPTGEEKLNIKTSIGESIEYSFERYASPGDWQIKARSAGLEVIETLVMREYKAVDMSLSGDILKIINIGNVPFFETVGVEFRQDGNITVKNEEISLDVGKETSIKLSAPEGSYDVTIDSNVMKKTFSNVSLTGSVISVRKLSDIRRENFIKYSSITLFLFIILFLIGKKLLSKMKEKRKQEALKSEEESIYRYMKKLKNE